VVPGYHADVTRIAQQARGRSITVPLLGTDGWDAPALLEDPAAAMALEGSYFVTHWVPDASWEASREFVAEWQRSHEAAPTAIAAFAYDAARLAIDAAREAGPGADPSAVRAALVAMPAREGVTGYLRLLPSREVARTVVVVRISGGHAVFHGRVDPRTARGGVASAQYAGDTARDMQRAAVDGRTVLR
jgi:branched-chain amino acid transport system substrate-binding protein